MMTRTLRAFSVVVCLGGVTAAATLPLAGVPGSIMTLMTLALLSAIAGSISVNMPRPGDPDLPE